MPGLSTRDTYVIIDGYSLLFRAFFATQYFATSDGRPTNALYGFTNMLFSLMEKDQPYGIAVVFDAPGKTFRHADYPEYKAHRRDTEDALKQQLPVARELVAALGIPQIEITGYEADDLAGTLARMAVQKGLHAMVVTGDRDQLQLVDENTTVRMTKRGLSDVEDYTPESFPRHFSFPPALIPDYKALRGDPSDNIPGVAGVGEKTANALLAEFGPVESILEHLDDLAPKVREKIAADPGVLALGKHLTTLICNAPIEMELEPYRPTAETLEATRKLFTNLEFRSLLQRIDAVLPLFMEGAVAPVMEVKEAPTVKTTLATSPEQVYARFSGLEEIALASGEEGIALSSGGEAFLVPSDMRGALDWLVDTKLIVHDGRAEWAGLREMGVPRVQFAFDTQLAAYVLAPGRGKYMLEDSCREFLEHEIGADAGSRAAAIHAVRPHMRNRMQAEDTLHVYEQIDLPLLPVLIDIERSGILVDTNCLKQFSDDVTKEIDALQRSIWDLAGEQFTIGSPKQLGVVLFEKLCLPSGKKTKTGFSTDVDVLTTLAAEHEICAKVLQWREYSKLKSTYADALPLMVRDDGRIHTTFYQTIAATGRLSSGDPNLQNIPVRSDLGREIRRAFIAPPGKTLLSLDYSQIELRLLAHMSRDPVLVEAFDRGDDIHAATASEIFGVGLDQVTSEHRRQAKMVNYAVLYGMSDFGLGRALGLGVSEAHGIIERYFTEFPSVKQFTESIVEEARIKGFTATLSGRRRYFPDIHSGNRQVRMAAERQAINAPIQGSAADVIKLAMIKIANSPESKVATMLLQVHDELVFEVDEDKTEVAKDLAVMMADSLDLSVPLEVDIKIGPNWRDMTGAPSR